jgi:hypothetical protein
MEILMPTQFGAMTIATQLAQIASLSTILWAIPVISATLIKCPPRFRVISLSVLIQSLLCPQVTQELPVPGRATGFKVFFRMDVSYVRMDQRYVRYEGQYEKISSAI